jgi:hypothetical protein
VSRGKGRGGRSRTRRRRRGKAGGEGAAAPRGPGTDGSAGAGPAVHWIVVAGSLLLLQAVVLTAIFLPAPHTGGDNAGYLTLALALAEGAGYVELWDPDAPLHTKYPPGYPLLLAAMILAGATSWAAFKLTSAVGMSLATLLVFAWAARRVGAWGAGALALLLVLAGGWQDASRWILSEPWFLVWTFLCLWAGDEASARGTWRPRWIGWGEGRPALEGEEPRSGTGLWVALAGAGALMAFGVRTAGLPLVLAFLGFLVLARRFRAAAVFGAMAVAVVGGWLLRASRGGEGAYQDEFWLRNPYDPELGTVGMGGLLGRVWENAVLYVGRVLPGEWWLGAPGWALAVLGLLVTGLALWGWVSRLLRAPGGAELFVPLYGGMILLWPSVWSGERFLLPLLPLLLLYAGRTLAGLVTEVEARIRTGTDGGKGRGRGFGSRGSGAQPGGSAGTGGPTGGGSRILLALGTLALALPAIPPTVESAGVAGECRSRVELTGDAFACHGSGFSQFRDAAAWMGRNLGDDAVALSRKPRILHALGGPRGRTFPFVQDAERFLAEADRTGARYLLVDHVDGLALRYIPVVVEARPSAFCFITAWGGDRGDPGTTLLGIHPPGRRGEEGQPGELRRCLEGWASEPPAAPEIEGLDVPLLVHRRSG